MNPPRSGSDERPQRIGALRALVRLLPAPPAALSAYAWLVGVLGVAGTAVVWWVDPPFAQLAHEPAPLLVLMGCLVLGELFPIPVARGDATTSNVTISTTFAVALIVLGPLSLVLLAHLVAVFLDDLRGGRRPVQMAFNLGQYALSILAARAVFASTSGVPLMADFRPAGGADLLPAVLAGLVFAVVNHTLVGVVVALATGVRLTQALGDDLRFTLETSAVLVGMAPVAALVVVDAPPMLPLVLLPIIAVRRSAQMTALSEQQALRDPLTGLGNRTSLQLHLARVRATPGRPAIGMLIVDLDHFKDVNDSLGHDVGDRLLVEVAARLTAVAPDDAHVARLGGDEFAVVVQMADRDTAVAQAEAVAGRLLEAFARPVEVGSTRLAVRGSVGVAVATDAEQVAELLKHADIALYEAKTERARHAVYEPRDDDVETERLTLLANLSEAVEAGRLTVAYQPQADCRSGRVVSFEALVRWDDPAHAHVGADTLVQLAENAGFIDQVFDLVLERALADLATWRAAGHDVSVGVNVSARQLSDEALAERIATRLLAHRVPAGSLVVEVTESSLMVDARRADVVLASLRALGVVLSIDDFGTGYSSLVRLKQIDVDELKIDQGFIADLSNGATNDMLLRTIIDLAANLGLDVVAEGVETEWAAATLTAMGCDRLQGYHLSRPVPAAEAVAVLEKQARDDAPVPGWAVSSEARRPALRLAPDLLDEVRATAGGDAPAEAADPAPAGAPAPRDRRPTTGVDVLGGVPC
ncbi:putative bifunctional diguanylate cyclase/phosphodiesterase [Jannaschia sp. R86511]|uniref:putative bifunctional diguanylate cyclase/phosphodiesterase n=1 Tax=Jannaschia sp. R86511 TaxID=3093853 RepID=UPI0036D2840C